MKRVKRQKIGSKPPGARGEARSTLFLTAPRRNQPCQHLDFRFLVSRHFLCFKTSGNWLWWAQEMYLGRFLLNYQLDTILISLSQTPFHLEIFSQGNSVPQRTSARSEGIFSWSDGGDDSCIQLAEARNSAHHLNMHRTESRICSTKNQIAKGQQCQGGETLF